jgi:5-methylcytosine-specific restriction endonuclease McrA
VCRKPPCTYLGADPEKWPSQSPIASPEWIRKSFFTFEDALKTLVEGDRISTIESLQKIPSTEISEYVRVHAFYAYITRFALIDSTKSHVYPQKKAKSPRRSERMPGEKLKRDVLERDSYTCQYCGNPVVRTEILRTFSKTIGGDYFPAGKSDSNRHGIYLAFAATWDHVVPFEHGGGSELSNLVTSCWPCNFGKYNYTLEELHLEDPRSKSKVASASWKGLIDFY